MNSITGRGVEVELSTTTRHHYRAAKSTAEIGGKMPHSAGLAVQLGLRVAVHNNHSKSTDDRIRPTINSSRREANRTTNKQPADLNALRVNFSQADSYRTTTMETIARQSVFNFLQMLRTIASSPMRPFKIRSHSLTVRL